MFVNEYTLILDIKNKTNAVVPQFVQYDNASLVFKILNDGKSYDMTPFTRAEVAHKRPDGKVVLGTADVESLTNGEKVIRYNYLGSEMHNVGFVETSLSIFSDNKKVSTLPFKVKIITDNRDGIVESSKEEVGLLQELIAEVSSVVAEASLAVANATQAVTVANQAVQDAENAVNLATANATLANEAATNANTKASLADTAATNANTKASLADEKAQLAQTAATNANDAILGVDNATSNANQAALNANNAATSANTATENVNSAIDATNTATSNANKATLDAQTAKQNADKATIDTLLAKQSTEQATVNANTAISNTNTATTNANKAATEANLAKDGALMAIASANTATQNANTSATNAQLIAENTVSKGSFVLGNAYKKNNLVLDNGSSWIAKVNTQNNPLPTLPMDENTWWKLVAQRGVDGTGSVVSVNSMFPDVNGNVTIDLGDSITKVDGFAPDANGNVVTHTNKDVLDKFSESNGNPQYNGTPIGAVASVNGQTGVVTGLETIANSDNKLSTKVDKVTGKQLSTEDFTAANKTKLTGIEAGAQVNAVTSVNGSTGAITGLETTVNADSKLTNKVDKVAGKQLSTEDFTTTEKTKLSNIADSANNYVHPTTTGNKHIPTGGATGNFLKYSASGTAIWSTPTSSDITESPTKKFTSDTKIAEWDAKATPEYVDGKTGILSDLTTTVKTDLVKALNEINAKPSSLPPDASTTVKGIVQLNNSVTSTSTTQAATANAVKTAYDRANEAFQSASDGKNAVASAVTAKGVLASPSDTFLTLATKIGQIQTGKKWASGTTSFPTSTVEVRGLNFRPSVIIVEYSSAQRKVYNSVTSLDKFTYSYSPSAFETGLWEIYLDGFKTIFTSGTIKWIAFE